MDQLKFSFNVVPTNPVVNLGFETWINDQCVFDTDHVFEPITVTGFLPDNSVETEHTLKLVLKNKQSHHTQISESGEILNDACLEISALEFDKIDLGPIINELTVYEHDFNGTKESIKDKFFGIMGCNGTVELKFFTPVYLWLLKNM